MKAKSDYYQAISLRFDIHEAIATANPYSVACLGFAADFLYNQGYLVYRFQNQIRLLDVHGVKPDNKERVVDLIQLLPKLLNGDATEETVHKVSLLSYSDDILIFRVAGITPIHDALFALDVRAQNCKRLLLKVFVPASAPIFVRHTRSYLWYGTFTDDMWLITGMDLVTSARIEFPLDTEVDGDHQQILCLGETLCFEMHDEHLYAVSIKVPTGDIVVHSSFYHWFCHAPRESGRKWNGRFWRRQQEGPTNEMWANLSIRKDEMTGRPVILECRREWFNGNSENHRTYYTQRLPTPEEALAPFSEGKVETPSWVTMDNNLNDRQTYHDRPTKRLYCQYHPEYESGTTKRQEFIPMRTKHSSYHLGASTFIDLVNNQLSDGLRTRDRLCLRTVSRKRKSPMDEEGIEGTRNRLFRPNQIDESGNPIEGSEERFESRGVCMWPPHDAPPALQQLLCPSTRIGDVKSRADERSIIYSVDAPDLPPYHQALILINFDPSSRLPLVQLPKPGQDGSAATWVPKDSFKACQQLPVDTSPGLGEETPHYMAIKRGYKLGDRAIKLTSRPGMKRRDNGCML
jgi:hypothetical protein